MAIGASYFGNRILRHVASDMEDLVARGFTGVLHTYSENDLTWNRAHMARIVEVSHDVGLHVQVGPWGVAHLFGGEAESLFAAQRPDLGQVWTDGRQVGATCPNQPEVRAFLRRWTDAAVESGADEVFWDEPHWAHPVRFDQPPEAWTCRCAVCNGRFRDEHGADLPAEQTPEVIAFREACLTELLAELVGHARTAGTPSTICLLPAADGTHGVAGWEPVAAIEGLGRIATDPYWAFFDKDATTWVGEESARIRQLADANGIGGQIWIQGFGMGPEQEEEIRAAVDAARAAGIDDLWTWGYEACGHLSHLRTREPERVWDILTSALTAAP